MTLESDLEKIREQEAALVFPHFDADMALEVGLALIKAAQARGQAVTIDIRRGEHIAFFFAMAGTTPENADWARRKRNTVELLHRSSYAIGLEHQANGTTLEGTIGLKLRDYACHGGSFPLNVQGAGFIGTITVSGLPQREDHNLIVGVLAGLLKQDTAALLLPPA